MYIIRRLHSFLNKVTKISLSYHSNLVELKVQDIIKVTNLTYPARIKISDMKIYSYLQIFEIHIEVNIKPVENIYSNKYVISKTEM